VRIGLALACAALLQASATGESILIAKAECRLLFWSGTELIKEYPCATGRGMCSPVGDFEIGYKCRNSGWAYEGGQWVYVGGARIPALGAFWMNLAGTNYGIHGTNAPEYIGQLVSHGCIRMHNKHADELYGMAPPGTHVKLVNQLEQGQPSLSKLRRYLVAYASNEGGDYDIYTIGSDSRTRRHLTHLPGDERTPVFSPDGSRVAFIRDARNAPGLCVVSLEDLAISDLPSADAVACLLWDDAGIVARLADGSTASVSPDDGARVPVDEPPLPTVTDKRDGVVIPSIPGEGKPKARTVSASMIRPKLPGPADVEGPALSADGARLALAAVVKKGHDIFACRSDGSYMRNITESEADEVDPSWSPVPIPPQPLALLEVSTEPPGLQVLVRPISSKAEYPRGRSPLELTLSSAPIDGALYEIIARQEDGSHEARAQVEIARGQRKKVTLKLTDTDEVQVDVESDRAVESVTDALAESVRRLLTDL